MNRSNMLKNVALIAAWCSVWALSPAWAEKGELVWLLGSDSSAYGALDNHLSATVTNKGIVATFSSSEGVLRRTKSVGLSVESANQGDRRGIDPGEFIEVVFDTPLMFAAVFVASWSEASGDRAVIKLNGAEMAVIEKTGYHKLDPFFVPAGWTLRIEGTGNTHRDHPNGWSITSFSSFLP